MYILLLLFVKQTGGLFLVSRKTRMYWVVQPFWVESVQKLWWGQGVREDAALGTDYMAITIKK